MKYNVGDKVYILIGIIDKNKIDTNWFIETHIVTKIGKYVTIGNSLDDDYTYNHRFVASANEKVDGYKLSSGQVKDDNSCKDDLCVWFGDENYTHLVFKTREDAEKFLYKINPNGIIYTFTNSIDYPKKVYNGTGEEKLKKKNQDIINNLKEYFK